MKKYNRNTSKADSKSAILENELFWEVWWSNNPYWNEYYSKIEEIDKIDIQGMEWLYDHMEHIRRDVIIDSILNNEEYEPKVQVISGNNLFKF